MVAWGVVFSFIWSFSLHYDLFFIGKNWTKHKVKSILPWITRNIYPQPYGFSWKLKMKRSPWKKFCKGCWKNWKQTGLIFSSSICNTIPARIHMKFVPIRSPLKSNIFSIFPTRIFRGCIVRCRKISYWSPKTCAWHKKSNSKKNATSCWSKELSLCSSPPFMWTTNCGDISGSTTSGKSALAASKIKSICKPWPKFYV